MGTPGPQCYDAFEEWVGDPLRRPYKEFPRHEDKPEIVKRPDGRGLQLISRHIKLSTTVRGIIRGARLRGTLLTSEMEFLRKFLVRSLSNQTFRLWRTASGMMANLFWEDDWTAQENLRKYALYVTACFIDFFRPGAVDWRTPNERDMLVVLGILDAFNKSDRVVEGQLALLNKLFGANTPLEEIGRLRRGRRLKVDHEDLWYVWETSHLSHVERAAQWDNRKPKAFRPFGRSNVEMHNDRTLSPRWRSGVNRLLKQARKSFGPHRPSRERKLN
jgi:hypothetical protein